MKKIVFFLWAMILTVALPSCKKDKASDDPSKPIKEVRITTEQRAYGYFLNGSYWIFRDTVTNSLDSFYVARQQVNYTERLINDTLFRFESIHTFLAGSTHSMIIGMVSDPVMYPNPESVIFLTYSKYTAGPSVLHSTNSYSIGNASISNSIYSDSVDVQNKWYKHIRTSYFSHAIDSPNELATGIAQWQKNGGLIKLKSVYNGSEKNLQLIRRSILQ